MHDLSPKSTSRLPAWRRSIFLAATLCLVAVAPLERLHAQTSTWTRTTDGNWSLAGNWDLLPAGGPATILTFSGAGTQAYVATNNLADPFFLNQIVLNSTSSGTPTIAGSKIRFVGAGAKIRQDGSGAFQFTAPLKFDVPLSLAGSGSGIVTLNGALSGMGGIIKTGSSTFVFGTPSSGVMSSNTFAGGITLDDGTLRFANAQDSGPTALRSNRLRLTSATASLLYGGTDFNTPTEIRLGELSGVAGSLFQARTINIPSTGERGLNVLITALGSAEFAGTFVNTGTGVADGGLKVRGIGNQTISGTFTINNDIEVFHGAMLTLAGSASIGSATAGKILVSGGTFVVDARTMSGNNLIRDGGTTNGGIDGAGGGTFRFIGKTAGSTETLGRLEIGDGTLVRSGALHIELVHNAGSTAPTVLTFMSYERSSGQPSRSTIDFAAFDGNGAAMLLGQTSSNPRIILSGLTATNLINSLLSRTSGSGLASVSGYATVNGTDFATYNTTNGIGAVATSPWTGSASSTTNFRLLANGNTGGSSTVFAVSSLKLDATGGALTLDISGSGNLQTNGILLAGSNNASITSTGGGAWIGVGARYAQVQQAVLTISASIADTNPLVKAGGGTLVLSSTANSASTAILTINEGVVRGSSATLPSGAIELRGGVLELSGGGTFNRTLGTSTGGINWNSAASNVGITYDKGSGGFAAFGAAVSIDLNAIGAGDISWRDIGFIDEGFALVFGSKTADALVTFVDNLGLSESSAPAIQAYNAREIQVVDNPNSLADFARLAGVVSGDVTEDLLKTGAGILELSGANTYYGGTIVAEGSLLLANASALGDATGAYVLLGARSGAADISLLTSRTSGSITIARDLLVQSGGSGFATIGNTLAPDAATTADALFSGDILVGLQGDTLAKGLKFNVVSGTKVTFSGAISTHPGYTGVVSLQKTGGGDVYLSGAVSYSGATTVSAGRLIVASGGTVSGSGGITVSPGATLWIASGGQVTGGGSINVSGSAPIDNVAVNRGTVIVDGTAGTSGASIIVGQGGLLQGNNGIVNGSVTIQRGGGIGPGNSVGQLNVAGPAASTWEAGSHFYFQFNLASGTVPGTDWDFLSLTTSRLTVNGTAADPIYIHIDSWLTPNTGHGANNFDASQSYHWMFAKTAGIDYAASGDTVASRFVIVDDTPGAGVFGTGVGNPATRLASSFYITQVGNELYVDYSAVPEPGSITLIAVATGAGMLHRYRKRRRKVAGTFHVP